MKTITVQDNQIEPLVECIEYEIDSLKQTIYDTQHMGNYETDMLKGRIRLLTNILSQLMPEFYGEEDNT